jgi:hypothetical protein
MISQKIFLSFVILVFVGSVSILPGCSEAENAVLTPAPQDKLDADKAKGIADASKL